MTAAHRDPPALAVRLLERLLPDDVRDAFLGDLEETWHARVAPRRGALAAAIWYWRETLAAPVALRRLLRPDPRHHASSRGDGMLSTVLADLRYAVRTIRRRPTAAAIVIGTLALGIGATTAIFSVADPVLFQPLPYPASDRLTTIWQIDDHGERGNLGFPTFRDVAARVPALSSVAAAGYGTATLTGNTEPELLVGQRVSWTFFRTLGVRPALGRDFDAAEDVLNAPRVVILSDGLWRRRFGGDSTIVGRAITLDGRAVSVVGVMPAGFGSVMQPDAQIWTPLRYDVSLPYACRSCQHLRVVARLAPGATDANVKAQLHVLFADLLRQYPDQYAPGDLSTQSLRENTTAAARPILLAILGAVALVLLVACVNVINMLLAQGMQRRGELAVRVALGADRGRIVRQLLTESAVLALVGGAMGVGIAVAGVHALVAVAPPGLPMLDRIGVDGRVLAFALVLTMGTGVAFGLVPALYAVRHDAHDDLRAASRRTIVGARATRSALVVAEVALALVLLVGSGLLLRSVRRLLDTAPGFDARGLLTMQIQTGGPRYKADSATWRYFDQVLAAARAVPGVKQAALTSQLPLSGDFDFYGVHPSFVPTADAQRDPSGARYAVSDGYLETMRIPVLRGRGLTAADRAGSAPVALIDSALAARDWQGRDPLGQRIRVGDAASGPWLTIVGIVGSVRQQSLATAANGAAYVPETQWRFADDAMSLVVRADGDPSALTASLRRAIWSIDRDQPIVRVATMETLMAATAGPRRFALVLFETFAALTIALAAAGIYGVLAGIVGERTRELGVRAALGATRSEIVGLVVRQGVRMAAIGIALGLVAAALLSRALASLLFGISRVDPITYVVTAAALLLVSVAACLVPARRAASVDPIETLRAE